MGRKERLEALEKFEHITIEEQPKEPEPEPPKGAKKKIEHFFFYYKWHLIIGVVAVILIFSFVRDVLTSPNYDLSILSAGSFYTDEESNELLTARLTEVTPDVNEDGEVLISIISIFLPEGEATSEADMASQMKLIAELAAGESMLFIFDEMVYESTFEPQEFLIDVFPDEENRYPLAGLAAVEGTMFDREGIYIGIRTSEGLRMDKEEVAATYEASRLLLEELTGLTIHVS